MRQFVAVARQRGSVRQCDSVSGGVSGSVWQFARLSAAVRTEVCGSASGGVSGSASANASASPYAPRFRGNAGVKGEMSPRRTRRGKNGVKGP
jgi:hypothetical protein